MRRGEFFGYYRSAVLQRELFPALPLAQLHIIGKIPGLFGHIKVNFKLFAVLQNIACFGMNLCKAIGIFAEIFKRIIIGGI